MWVQDKPIYVGQDVELFCTILTKDPDTKYRWYYSDAKFPSEHTLGVLIDPRLYKQPLYNGDSTKLGNVKFTLMLKNLTIDQSGHYACQAENVVANESRVTNLTVTYRPIIPVTSGMVHTVCQPRPQGTLRFQNGGPGVNPLSTRLPKYSKNREVFFARDTR